MGRPSAFKSDEARADYCRLYDAAIALSPVPLEESDVQGGRLQIWPCRGSPCPGRRCATGRVVKCWRVRAAAASSTVSGAIALVWE